MRRYDVAIDARYELFTGPIAERVQPTRTRSLGSDGCTLLAGQDGARAETPGMRVAVHLALPVGEVCLLGVIAEATAPRLSAGGALLGAGTLRVVYDAGQPLPGTYAKLLEQLERPAPSPAPPVVDPITSGRVRDMLAAQRKA